MEHIQQKAMKIMKGMDCLLHEKRLRELALLSLEKRKKRVSLTNVYRYSTADGRRQRFFFRVHGNRSGDNGHKLEHEIFIVRVVKQE